MVYMKSNKHFYLQVVKCISFHPFKIHFIIHNYTIRVYAHRTLIFTVFIRSTLNLVDIERITTSIQLCSRRGKLNPGQQLLAPLEQPIRFQHKYTIRPP